MLVGRIEFDPEAFKKEKGRVWNLDMPSLHEEVRLICGAEYSSMGTRKFLTMTTRALMSRWNDNTLFLLWAKMYRITWSTSLPEVLQRQPEFEDVSRRYRTDPRRKYMR